MPKIQEVIQYLDNFAPPSYQESYDNSGLLVGDLQAEVNGILLCLDSTEAVVQEAIERHCNLIIAHHPIIFKGLKKITGKNHVERTILKAIRNDVAIYAIHTNLDNIWQGVNYQIAQILGLQNIRVLSPKPHTLSKLTTFVPQDHTKPVLQALSKAGAGQIGNYQNCSFRTTGIGTFQPNEYANPHIGTANQLEEVQEDRIEVIFPSYLQNKILQALRQAHPYEEIAYYLHLLENHNQEVGSGAIGTLTEAMPAHDFLAYLKQKMHLTCIKHTALLDKKIQTIALCGGAGISLLPQAIAHQADIFITADIKYHEFFEADQRIILADIGHYESEIFTKNLLFEVLSKKFTSFAIYLANTSTNPVNYFI
ncbi:MAG: Nif3-like dinuclear metal center hexameric protein [Microscillaceae bacterium]|nr:Nif3-like dinuclear metal center hexameric protein [Microscillaceae bacterium]MDW8460927.1 Nif3-like dinuclear metal center hexameric protein [Cytophagales bacterium]